MSTPSPLDHVEAWLKEYYALDDRAREARSEQWVRLGRWFRDEQKQRVEAIVCFESALLLRPDHAEAKTAAVELRARPPRAMTSDERAVVQAAASYVPELPSQWDPGPPPGARALELREQLERLMSQSPSDLVTEGEKLWELSVEVKLLEDLFTEALTLRAHRGASKYLEATRKKYMTPPREPGEIDPRTDRLAFDHAVAKLIEGGATSKVEGMLLKALERGGPPELVARLRRGLAHLYFDLGMRQRALLFFEELARTDKLHALEQTKLAALREPPPARTSKHLTLAEQHRKDPARRVEAILAYEAALREDPSSTPAKQALDEMRGRAPTAAELGAFDPLLDWYAYDRKRIEMRARALVASEQERGRALIELLRAAGTPVDEVEAQIAAPVPQHRFPWERMTDAQKKQEREVLVAYMHAWKAGRSDPGTTFMTLGKLWREAGDRMRAILAFAMADNAESRRALAEMFEWPAPSLVPGEIDPTKDWAAFEKTMKDLDRAALRRAFDLVAREERTPSAITSPNGRPGTIAFVLARHHWREGDVQTAASLFEMIAGGGVDLEMSRDVDSLRRELGV